MDSIVKKYCGKILELFFSFLLIMILVLKIQSFLIGKISFDDSSVDTSDLSTKSNRGVDQKKVAVISAAIKQHESDKK